MTFFEDERIEKGFKIFELINLTFFEDERIEKGYKALELVNLIFLKMRESKENLKFSSW